MANTNMTAHVLADIPEWSDTTPAIIPPTIPPTSKNVDKVADDLQINVDFKTFV